MDEAQARSHIEAHADAVARGDMDAVVADFTQELRPQVPDLAPQLLPLPVKQAQVVSVDARRRGDGYADPLHGRDGGADPALALARDRRAAPDRGSRS